MSEPTPETLAICMTHDLREREVACVRRCPICQVGEIARLRAALNSLYGLVEDGLLVRNPVNDGDFSLFLAESVRLVKVLTEAQAARTVPLRGSGL